MAKPQKKNNRKLSAKIRRAKNQMKTIKKKPKVQNNVEKMEVDNPNKSSSALKKQIKLNVNKKKRRLEKMSKNAVEHLPESTETQGKVKRITKINEDRLHANDCPLFLHPNAENLKNIVRDQTKGTVVVPTRRVTKKKIRKLLKVKQREERAAERAAKTMDTS